VLDDVALDDLLRIVLEIHPPSLLQIGGLKSRADFWRYQVILVDLIKRCVIDAPDKLPGLLAALPPGAGKTVVVLTAMRDLLDAGTIRRVLITSTVLVCQTVWPEEFDEWAHLSHSTHTLIRVEDNDAEVAAIGQAAYDEALGRRQEQFDSEVAEEARRNPRKSSALAIVRDRWEKEALAAESEDERLKRAYAVAAQTDPDWPEDKKKPRIPTINARPGDFAEQEVAAAAKNAKLGRLAAEETEFHIINKEALPWFWKHLKNGRDWKYDVVIGDDLREFRSGNRRVKQPGSKKATKADPLSRWGVLAACRKYIKAFIELTGTPTPKGLDNLWGAIYLIDQGERLGTSKKPFLQRWFERDQYTRKVTPKGLQFDVATGAIIEPGWAFNEVMSKITDIAFSIDEADLADLPPFVIDPIKVRLPDKVLAEYKRFERKMVSEEYDVEAVNGGVLHGKLLQFANGSMYQEGGDDVFIHDAKIDALKELVERLNGTPLLVAYTYKFDVERICKALPFARVLTPDNAVDFVRDWNADRIPLALAHRASAAHGLNMQKGAGHMCEYGLTSDAELFIQFLKRLLRPGRLTTVLNHVIIAEGTIDEAIFPMYLNPKIEMQNRILERLRIDAR
jgi:hypothetical protein